MLSSKFGNSPFAFGARLAEQATKELDVLADAEVRIEVLAQSLRHIGDAGANGARCAESVMSPIEHKHMAGLDLPCAGYDAEQRRLSDPVGPDQADHAAGRQLDRDRVECNRTSVTLRDIVKARDRCGQPAHCGASPCSEAGQLVAGSVST